MTSSAAASRKAAPGRCTARSGAIAALKTCVNSVGATTPAIPMTPASAPWRRPCSVGLTSRVSSPCIAGYENPNRAERGMPARNSMPVGASAYTANAAAPNPKPVSIARRSPKRATAGPTSTPCTIIDAAPTAVSALELDHEPREHRRDDAQRQHVEQHRDEDENERGPPHGGDNIARGGQGSDIRAA